MDTTILIVGGAIAVVFIFLLVIVVVILLSHLSTAIQNLSQAVQQGRTEIAMLAEKVANIEPVTRTTLTDELAKVQQDLAALRAHTKARQDIEQQIIESVKRLEMIIAGTQSKGAAGENIVELVFAKLPIEWQVSKLYS